MGAAASATMNNLDWDHRPVSNKAIRSLVGYMTVTPGIYHLCHFKEWAPASNPLPHSLPSQDIKTSCMSRIS